ncbi:MAG TPA: hypothetical protein VJ970_04125, partial [Flavobacteriaceae bacterium]|nr:hypothetical protein [Flavobacteriaceae bacterium]
MKKLQLLGLLFFTSIIWSQSNPFITSPAISPDGTTIAFNYQGDVWTVSKTGNNLKRLTIHEAYDTNPHWSADGKTIAFNSDRFGNADVFTIPVIGGNPERITYHSANDVITDFTKKGDIYFTTNRNFVQIEREPEVHSVGVDGGTPFRLLNALGFDATLSPNGKLIAFTRGSCRVEREAYQGPANRDIWLYNTTNDTFTQLTDFNGQDLAPQWGNNNTLYFQSARSGKYNIHKLKIDNTGNKTGAVEKISNLKEFGLFSYHLSKNG